jgi:hypothetical protein
MWLEKSGRGLSSKENTPDIATVDGHDIEI